MARNWIDEGLRHERERETQQHVESEHRHHDTSVLKDKGPDLMRRLVAEIGAIVEEYRGKAHVDKKELEFEELPQQGFCLTKTNLPRVDLECRPDYEAHVVRFNMTRTEDQESDPTERIFTLNLILDPSGHVKLSKGAQIFQSVDEAAESILTPVLFPLLDQRP